MHVSIKHLLDYKTCPQMYKFRHVDMLPEKADIARAFRLALRKTISFYYFSLMEQKKPSLHDLMGRWEKVWFSKQIEETFLQDEIRERSNAAVGLIRNFHRYARVDKEVPVAIDFRYEALFEGEVNLHVSGNIDLIRVVNDKTRNKEVHLVFFSYSRYHPSDFLSQIDLNTTLASYAFRKGFKEKEDKIVLCNIGKKQESAVLRTGNDFERCRKICYNIVSGIENKIFYPADNYINCKKCNFRTFCINEKAMEDRNGISKELDNRR